MTTSSLITSYSASSPTGAADGPSGSSPPRLLDASVAFRVVGVGASAGGMDAFRELLRHLPDDTGMAFVLIQHLHRTGANVLRETLAKATRMIVSEVQGSTRLVPNCVYVIPSTADVTMRVNRLSLVPRPTESGKPHAPVNLFLNSLAAARGHQAVGVLLSGNTTDGTEGLRAIRDARGVTMVQEPSSAKFGDMPAHAIKAGVVEFCLPIPALARKLVSLSDDLAQDAIDLAARSSDRTDEMRSMALSPLASRLDFDVGRHFDRLLVSRYCPAAALVDDQLEVLLTRGQFSEYVQLAPGVPRSSLSRMASGRMLAELKSAIVRCKAEQSPVRIDAMEVGPPEMGRTCNVVVSPFSGPHRSANDRFVVAFEDTSHDHARAAAKQLAEKAGRASDHFMSLVTHELRTPLASVLMHAQLLRTGALDRARTEEALAAIERAASLQTQMVNDLIDLSLLESGRLKLDLAEFELCDVVRETLVAFAPLIASKSLNLRTQLDDSVGQIHSDRARVRQIAGYLVGNAIRSTPAGGEIAVTLTIEDGDACLCVRDSGTGIDPELLPEIFSGSPSRAGSSSRGGRRGGLGLAIARHLIDALGGRASAQSAGLDRGATFRLTFPMTKSIATRSEPDDLGVLPIAARPLDRPAHTQSYTELQGVRVLVLDDEEGTLEAVQTVCRLSGMVVRGVTSVSGALREFDRFEPQLLVCDPVLSREDGLDFIRQIRARSPAQGGLVPAMALTAVAGQAERERAIATGFQLYVVKPLDIDRLRDAMVRLVRHDRTRQQS